MCECCTERRDCKTFRPDGPCVDEIETIVCPTTPHSDRKTELKEKCIEIVDKTFNVTAVLQGQGTAETGSRNYNIVPEETKERIANGVGEKDHLVRRLP